MSQSRTPINGGNPGKAGPKGALGLPTARNKKRGRQEDRNEQRQLRDPQRFGTQEESPRGQQLTMAN